MEALCSSKAVADLSRTTCRHITEGENLNSITDKTALDTHNVKKLSFGVETMNRTKKC
jgi:hypothetical protein